MTSAFASAAPGAEIEATRAAVARVSAETARDGASRSFEGGGPSVSVLRQLMFVPAQNAGPDPAARVMEVVSGSRPLSAGTDNAAFSGGKAQNIVDGYTAVYAVVPSGGLVLVYNVGIQSRPDTASQQSRLNEGQKTEYRELVRRLEASFEVPKLPYRPPR